MPSEPTDITNFKGYVKLGVKEGRPYIFLGGLLYEPEIRRRALTFMSYDWEKDRKLLFDAVVGLPHRGSSFAPAIAEFSGSNTHCFLMEKGTKLDQEEYATVTYFKDLGNQTNGRTASGRVSRRHLQIERSTVAKLVEECSTRSSAEIAQIYGEIPWRNGRLVIDDSHAERLKEARKPRALLIDGFLEDGKKAIAAAELLESLGVRTIGLGCVVELRDWHGEKYLGRESLKERGIAVRSLLVYENGAFRPTWSVKEERIGESGGGEVVTVRKSVRGGNL